MPAFKNTLTLRHAKRGHFLFGILGCVLFSIALGCVEVEPQPPATALEADSSANLSGKADGAWVEDHGITLDWSEVLQCTIAATEGAWDGATGLVDRLWHLPGAIYRLIRSVGQEIWRREADRLAAFSDAEALERVRATYESDLKAIRGLLLSLRRLVPELWISLQEGSGWFETLERGEKIQFVCEVTGRMTFEVISMILTDKGFTQLIGLTRLRLVEGVTSRLLDLARYARLAHTTALTIEDVGTRISGERERRWSQPALILGELAEADSYLQGCQRDGRTACPSILTLDEETWNIHSNASQWERLSGFAYLDALIPDHLPIPSNAIFAETVPLATVRALLESEGLSEAETDVILDHFEGQAQRVFFPGDTSFRPINSPVFEGIKNKIGELEHLTETPLEKALLLTGEYWNRTPLERFDYLDTMIEEARLLQPEDNDAEALFDYL